jgi:hypothetical protein
MILIPEYRLRELLESIHPDAARLPPGWLDYARMVELELQAYMEQAGWVSPTGELYRSQIAMPRAEQDQARAVYAKRHDRPTAAVINTAISKQEKQTDVQTDAETPPRQPT